MSRLLAAALLALSLLQIGCAEQRADTASPQTYSLHGVTFDYPSNWRVTGDSFSDGIHHLSVETPGDAILILLAFPAEDSPALQSFAEGFSESTRQEMPFGQIGSPSFGPLKPLPDGSVSLKENFTISLLGTKTPHVRDYLRKPLENRTVFLIAQSASSDQAKVTPGFDQIISSLRSAAP
jgi:hypothetical protein